MKYLITGGAGFIGINAVNYFMKRGEVSVVDKLTYAASPWLLPERITFYNQDICTLNWKYLLDFDRPDVIINFAAESHVDNSIQDHKQFLATNIGGVSAMITGIQEAKAKPLLIHISTDEVLGDAPPLGGSLVYDALCPNNPYAATKAAAELLIQSMHHTHADFDYLILRATNNYGPGQHWEKFIPTVILNGMLNNPIPVYGKGDNIREWLWVGDFVCGIDLAIRKYPNMKKEDEATCNKVGQKDLTLDRDWNAAINLSNLPVGNGNVKPVEREALASRYLSGETTLCEAGTGLGKVCPSFRNQDRYDRILHFGSNSSCTNLQLVKLILEKLGKTEDLIEFVQDRPGHDKKYSLNWDDTLNKLSWYPSGSLEAGLDIVIKDIKERVENDRKVPRD